MTQTPLYLVQLQPDDGAVMRDLAIQSWLTAIYNTLQSGGGGGVSQLVAGTGISLSPAGGTGTVTITATGGVASIAAYTVLGNNTSASATPAAITQLILGTPAITDTGIATQYTGSVAGYEQVILQNTNVGVTASSDFVVNNNLGTASTYYANFGINSSFYTGSGSFNLPSASYLTATSGDLAIGTTTSNAIHFVVNNGATDALTISSTGAVTIGPGAITLSGLVTAAGLAAAGALPSGATTAGLIATFPATTYTVTGTNTATAFQAIYHGAPTITNASVGTITDNFSEVWAGPTAVAGSQVQTRAHTLGILDATSAASSITGGLVVATTFGTTATSVGIGGGNVNAGGLITGGTITSTGLFTASSTSTFTGATTHNNAVTINGATATTALTITNTARTSGVLPYIKYTIPTDTAQTASTESPGIVGVTGTRTWATTGTVALQREIFFPGPTYASASASQTFTDAFNMYLTPPVAGTNAIFTRGHSLGIVDATSSTTAITGGVVVATTLGTAATSVGIGGGNITAGGAILASTSTGRIGYLAGSGVGTAVTQLTSRTTGVTSNTPTGAITLFAAAGSTTPATFTVSCTSIAIGDTVVFSQSSGTNQYAAFCTAISAGTSFNVTFYALIGTASDSPVINYAIVKGSSN